LGQGYHSGPSRSRALRPVHHSRRAWSQSPTWGTHCQPPSRERFIPPAASAMWAPYVSGALWVVLVRTDSVHHRVNHLRAWRPRSEIFSTRGYPPIKALAPRFSRPFPSPATLSRELTYRRPKSPPPAPSKTARTAAADLGCLP
jgi:hypothetical protein